MARRQALIAKKTKKPRVSRNEAYLVNFKYMGDEPILKENYTSTEYMNALNWYNTMCTVAEARTYIKDYLKQHKRNDELKSFNRVPDVWVSTTCAWIAKISLNGTEIKEDSKEFFREKMKFMLSKAAKEENTEEKAISKPVVSIQQRMREKSSDIIGEIEEMLDKNEEFSLYDWLKANQIPATYVSDIVNKYTPWLAELIEAYEGEDEQLKEGYRCYTKKQLKERIVFFNKMIEDAERYGSVTKKTRAVRKPRPVSVEKKLKNFKYQKESSEYKIASVNPAKIIGCQELWTFNTKYKTITVLRALDRGGLNIKGTSIVNYDEKNSFTKRTGRKPEEHVNKVLTGGKIILRKITEELKKDASLAYRINENTVLLKVI